MSSKDNTSEVFGPLVKGDVIKSIYRKRSSPKIFQSISSPRKDLLKQKVEIAEQEGWIIEKKFPKSVRMSVEKKLDVQLEDEVWCIVSQMGYHELSENRQFKIEIPKDPNPRQIDVFAKDDEVALVIECTQSEKPVRSSKKDIADKIHNITDIKGEVINAIRSHYGRETILKPRFIIATRNVDWGDEDLEKCKSRGISVITESELKYFKLLTKHLKIAARHQFHAHLFQGIDIPALRKIVPATKGMMGGTKCYSFMIEPSELLKIAYVSHKSSVSAISAEDDMKSYQRMLKPHRLRNIAKYISDGGRFPTNIVVNFKNKRPLKFDQAAKKEDGAFGKLELPNQFASAWVIDGQHRLYAYAYSKEVLKGPKNDKSVLSVLAFENLPSDEEMKMFIDINHNQVKVPTNLLIELHSDLHWDSPEADERYLALLSRICFLLNTQKTSPVYDRIAGAMDQKTYYKCLTQATISNGLVKAGLIGKADKKNNFINPGPLFHKDSDKLELSLKKAVEILCDILELFKERVPHNWELGDKLGGYLCTNNAIRAIFHVIADICAHIEKDGRELAWDSAQEVISEVKKSLEPLLKFFERASLEEFQTFRGMGHSLDGVKRQSHAMNHKINKLIPNYRPDGFDKYLNSLDQKGKEEGMIKIDEMSTRINRFTINKLKEIYGPDEKQWWVNGGVRKSIVQKCSKIWIEKNQEGKQYHFLNIVDYELIAQDNWEHFREVFALDEKDSSNPNKSLKWVNNYNELHNKIVHQPERGMVTKEEFEQLQNLYNKIVKSFPSADSYKD